jgi:hypothetical protein
MVYTRNPILVEEVGALQSSQGKSMSPYLKKKKIKQKGLVVWLKW